MTQREESLAGGPFAPAIKTEKAMTKKARTTYQIESTNSDDRPFAVVEKSQYGKDVLRTFKTHADARHFLAGLKKSAVPRLSALLSFGYK